MGFDLYDQAARYGPAVLLLFGPALAAAVVFSPSIVAAFSVLAVNAALGLPLAPMVREAGKRHQLRLWAEWGGPPLAQRLAGPEDAVRSRAVNRLQQMFPDIDVPSSGTVGEYVVAADLARQHVRGTGDPVIASENRSYGFHRNLLGVRAWGVTTSGVVAVLLAAYALYDRSGQAVAGMIAGAGVVLFWMAYPTVDRVRMAAFRYADAVVGSLAAHAE